MSQCVFVTATDTEQGKTRVSEQLLRVFNSVDIKAVGFKPIAAGASYVPTACGNQQLRNEDAQALRAASFRQFEYADVNPQCFAPAIAPHLATDVIDFEPIDRSLDRLQAVSDLVVIEGAGGWLLPTGSVPERSYSTLADWVEEKKFPVIVVVGMRLGCLNHALLTVESVQRRGLNVVGWVANQACPDVMPELSGNLATLRELINAPYMGYMPYTGHSQSPSEWVCSEPFRAWLSGFQR